MFGLCQQSIYYLMLTVIAEVAGILIIGFDNWIQYFKTNYLFSVGGIIIYLIIIQTLCYFDKSTMAWVLFWITFVVNTLSLLAALGKKLEGTLGDMISKTNPHDTTDSNNNENKSTFNRSADDSCKSSCEATCRKNPNKPHDYDCNSYCNNACNRLF